MKSVPASPREIPKRHAPWDSASATGSKIRSSMATSMSKADKSPAPPKPNRIYSAPSKLHGKPAAVSIGRKVNGLRIHVKHGCCSLACILAIARRGGMIPVTAARNVSPRMKSVPASPREIPRRHAPWDSASVTGSKIRSSMATSMSKADKSPAPPKPNRIYSAPSKLHGKL
ncbi:hypothetical protein HYQ46_001757 [Verticillium longisporum]|nr:hypothetical protein HYQ46_001757 [Verticillium longisporum]